MTTPAAISTLQADLGKAEVSAASALSTFFGTALLGWGEDQARIFANGLGTLITTHNSGSTWSEAFTAAENEIEEEEIVEGNLMLTQVLSTLEAVAKTAEALL